MKPANNYVKSTQQIKRKHFDLCCLLHKNNYGRKNIVNSNK